MKPFALWLSAVALLATASAASHAGYTLSLSTSADAAHLHVGDNVTFDVTLSGINTSDSTTFLSYLAATIGYDNSLFSANPTVTLPLNTIVPDASGFVGTGFSNAADGFYDGVFLASTPISQNGTFFSFTVTATNPGSGTLAFSAAAATLASDPDQTNQFTPDTVNLDFHIDSNGPGTAVPEPSAFVLLISSMFGLSAGAGLRGLVRRVCLGK